MILVDTSVLIASLRGMTTEAVRKLHAVDLAAERIVVGDLILMEVLMGARDEANAARIRRNLERFEIVAMSGHELVVDAARNYRVLRGLGRTVRGGLDILIGTFCIRAGYRLLHDDRDFEPMERHLGLVTV
jgi:predicted nucleic acid-binding protein